MSATIVSIPATAIPEFDELYVISDLHLGGHTGFQIFDSAATLKGLIDLLRETAPQKKIALVINGDFVDFLAEMPAKPFDPAKAVEKLERVTGDPGFAEAWTALRMFAGTIDRFLIINLGNHDLELAFPWVRFRLLELLAGNDAATRGRITLAFDGTGFLCRVGGANVLCVHGNEADDWNVADHESIRRIGQDIVHGRPVDSWVPNAGSQLVVEVMNNLKRRYPFVDLLKPEVEAVLPALVALAPSESGRLRKIASVVGRLGRDKVRRASGFLNAEEEIAQESLGSPAGGFASPRGRRLNLLNDHAGLGRQAQAEAMLQDVEERLARNLDPMSLIDDDERGEYLSFSKSFVKFVRSEDTAEVLREALQDLRKDRSFDWRQEDTTFRILDQQIGDSAEFVVAGHTHLERALPRARGRGCYFNSGTWARLIKLETESRRRSEI
jgi:UDP-2,3-diacylglucosamine pyrophosphatase LpxH